MRPFKRLATFGLPLALALAACASPAVTPAPTAVPPQAVFTAPPSTQASAVATVAANAAATNAPAAAATTAPAQPAGIPAQDQLFGRPLGAAGPLVAYNLATGEVSYRLPAGRLAADNAHYFAATSDGDNTLFSGYDLATGAPNLQATVTGHWQLGAVSPNGRWAALARVYPATQTQQWTNANWQSEIQIVDTQAGQAQPTVKLDGNFEIDGLSNAGDSLYVIQYLPAAKPDHYQVRLYDLAANALQDGALVDKRDTTEVMAGERWTAVGSPNGEWLLSLYLRPQEGNAFIHALNLTNRFTWCIDLPSSNASLDQLRNYTLALAPDGLTIYAANAALGLVTKVNLDDLNAFVAAKFPPTSPASGDQGLPPGLGSVAPDGRSVYFTDGFHAFAYDTQRGAVRAIGVPGPITGLGVSGDSRRVFLARASEPLMILDAATGSALGFNTGATTH